MLSITMVMESPLPNSVIKFFKNNASFFVDILSHRYLKLSCNGVAETNDFSFALLYDLKNTEPKGFNAKRVGDK